MLVAGLLVTTATSVRSPHYARVGDARTGTAYLHNASLRQVDVHVGQLDPKAAVDCDAVLAGSVDPLEPGMFLPRLRWVMRSGENLPLWWKRDGEERACHVVLVRIDNRSWAVAWREGAPAVHDFPHDSNPGEPPTAGGIRAVSNGATWMLRPPEGVVVVQLDRRRHRALVVESTVMRAPGAIAATTYATGASIADEGVIGDAKGIASLGMRFRNVVGRRLGYAAGTDFDVGTTGGGGFAYNFNMYGLGLGGGGARYMLGVTAGGGLSGITGGRAGFAWQVPVEAFAAVDVTRRLRVGAWARSQWIFREDARQSGAPSAPFGDELHAGLSVDVLWANPYQTARPGVSLMLTYSEMMGTEIYGVGIGATVNDWTTATRK